MLSKLINRQSKLSLPTPMQPQQQGTHCFLWGSFRSQRPPRGNGTCFSLVPGQVSIAPMELLRSAPATLLAPI